MRIGILTSGGDCPGINATIRGVCKTAINHYGMEVIGIHSGFQGLLTKDIESFTDKSLSGLLNQGGTMLGTSREKPFKKGGVVSDVDKPALILQNIQEMGLDCVVCIGGNGTQKTAAKFAAMGVNIVSVPKTIDNDLASTDTTFGFDTAVATATESIDRLRTTAESHSRVIVVEVMGRYAGFIAIASALAGGCDAALIPEVPYDINKVADAIKANRARGKNFALVVVAEGAKPKGGDVVVSKVVADSPDPIRLGGIGEVVSEQLERLTGLESRATILGHVQRGGTPTANDRILSTRYGTYAVELLMQGKFGNMVVLNGAELGYDSLENVIGKNKAVEEDSYWIRAARGIGMCLGD